jgi:hypothetical protein
VKPGELVLLIQEPADVNNALPEPIGDADPSTQATSQEPLATTP